MHLDKMGVGRHSLVMIASARVQRVREAAADLSREEREELVRELILGLEASAAPVSGHDASWSEEIRRRVDDVLGGRSRGTPWSQVRRETEEALARRRAP